MTTTTPTFVIEARGTQSYGVRVIEPTTGEIKRFPTRRMAREYASSIKPEMPSKNLPLVVVLEREV